MKKKSNPLASIRVLLKKISRMLFIESLSKYLCIEEYQVRLSRQQILMIGMKVYKADLVLTKIRNCKWQNSGSEDISIKIYKKRKWNI